ncbi:MAG: 4-hydroxybenzoate octaprenyltransferase [Azoarcus sp.]|jgi:4-hydroxybenzoate polyprenyltransferase|nr:4-hydroxybenzoate octaprenyltransferase [Azoarcus sp.]
MNLVARLPRYAQLIRVDTLDKQVGTLLLLWPTMWALWLAAGGMPPLHLVAIFAFGSFLMHSAGCIINDYADRDIDKHVERTRLRPLASGTATPREALWLVLTLLFLACLLLLALNNRLVFWLALGALALTASYPFTKRFLPLPQAYLGVAYGFGIPMAYAAVRNAVPAEAWVLLLGNLFWVIAFDTEYAMVDRADDLKLGHVRSSAITFGRYEVRAVMTCYAAAFALVAAVGLWVGRGWVFLAGLAVAAAAAAYIYTLIRGRERDGCWRAFVANNWVGVAIFIGLALDFVARG